MATTNPRALDGGLEDGISSVIMEVENTADYYFPLLVEHWNNSVNSVIQMGHQLGEAKVRCSDDEFATLSKRLDATGIASKKQQSNLMDIPKSTMVLNYYKECAKNGQKPSLPNDWKTLHAVTLLSKSDFDSGIRNEIIGATTTVGDINKLKAGTHLKLPNPKTVKSSVEKLEGKKIAQIAIDFEKIETKKQAEEIDTAIETALNAVSNAYEFAATSTKSVGEMFIASQKSNKEKAIRKQEAVDKKFQSFADYVSKIDPSMTTKIPPEITKAIKTFS